MAEVFVERMHLALEVTRGTAVTTPTHTFNMQGLLTPGVEYTEPMESRGELASVYRPSIVQQGSAFTLEGNADVNYLPVLANMAVAPLTSPATPTNGVLTRLWSFIPNMTADDIESATLIWDHDTQSLVADYCMIDTLTLSNDANGTDGLMASVAGAGGFPSDIATPTPATNIAGALMPGKAMQLWIDTGADAIGTTELTATHSLVTVQHVFTTGVTYKHLSGGPLSALDFSTTGRDKSAVRCVTNIQVEMPSMTLYDFWTANTTAKVRVRHNGSLIESVTPDYYNYVEVDTYGKLKFTGWGVNQNSNRVANYTIESIKDATLGAGYSLAVQNARATL